MDTIAAIATPIGRGGIGIVRISGPLVEFIANNVIKQLLKPQIVYYENFYHEQKIIDKGLAIYFKKPNSFTGEDVLELHGHGGPVVLDMILNSVLSCGARLAKPGEFSERAFINNKVDLAQAEAIADLINASSQQAANSAMKSLQGDFSKLIHQLTNKLIYLRAHVEAEIDFVDEEIDLLSNNKILNVLDELINAIDQILISTKQGILINEGMNVVIAGKPNAGKSSLLNCLSGKDAAIISETAGTTRDVLREHIHIDGMPLHIIDTAGLGNTQNEIEKEGVRRAWNEIEKADKILLIIDVTKYNNDKYLFEHKKLLDHFPKKSAVTIIYNKIDLINRAANIEEKNGYARVYMSAKTYDGLDLLRTHLKKHMGFNQCCEGVFTARRRHLCLIQNVKKIMTRARKNFINQEAKEFLAEDLTHAQNNLSQITGEFATEDLLGEIFSTFCIGK